MKRTLCVVALLALGLLRPSVAAADTLTFVGLGKGSAVSVTIGSTTEHAWAGEINWLHTNSGGFTEIVTTYCADLFENALNPQFVVETLTSLLTPSSKAEAAGRAAWLVNTYGGTINESGTNAQAAGLQLAIWQTMYLSATVNPFSMISASAEIMSWANTYFNSINGQTSVAVYYNAVEGEGQDQIRVSEPATILLLMIGMMMTLGYQYRPSRRGANA